MQVNVKLVAALIQAVGGEIRVSDELLAKADPTKVEVSRDEIRQVTVYRVTRAPDPHYETPHRCPESCPSGLR